MHKKLDYIDSLRGIAVLLVLMVHIGSQCVHSRWLGLITGFGAKGVQLFFFISAFTLFLSYNNQKSKGQFSPKSFFIRRFLRIAPLYYLGIVYYSFELYLADSVYPSLTNILVNFSFLHAFFPKYINALVPGGWSIGVEMLFYLFIPVLTLIITSLKRAFGFLIFSIIARFFLNYLLIGNPFHFYNPVIWEEFLYWYLPNQLPCFAFGILFFFIQLDYKLNPILITKQFLIGWSVLVILEISDKFLLNSLFFNNDIYVLTGIIGFVLFLSKYPIKIFVNKFSILVGKLSYSIYIIHSAIIFWFIRFGFFKIRLTRFIPLNFLYIYILICLITIILSLMSYKFIESKVQMMSNKLIKKQLGN